MKLFLPIIVALTMGCALGQVNITTYQVDSAHTGQNLNETVLSPSTVSATGAFGALFTQPLDGQCYAQPLYMSNVKIANGTIHNILFVATQHDSVYAFDADTNTGANASPLWHTSFLSSGVTTVPTSDANTSDITNEIGITATPVIDPATNTLYTVSKTKNTAAGTYDQYLHALDITSGAEKFGGPVSLDSILTSLDTSAAMLRQHLRGSLELSNGILYLAYASHSDVQPYHGLILAFNATTLAWVNTFNDTPHGSEGGIWSAGAGPAIDSSGNLFVTTGNGTFDQTNAGAFDLSESFIRLPPATTTAGSFYPNTTTGYFTLNNQATLTSKDLDLGSSGVVLLPDQTGGTHPHIMVSGGKAGVLYVVDRDNLGGYSATDQDIQEISDAALFCSPSYFNGNIYYAPAGGHLTQRAVGYNSATGGYISTTSVISSQTFSNHGSSAFISANSANLANTGILWIINGATPSVLYAYNPANVAAAPYVSFTTSYTNGSVVNSTANKFAIPTVVNGKVYLTGYDPSLTTGRLYVLGLLNANSAPAAPSNLVANPTSSTQVTLNWTNNASNESGFNVFRSTSSSGPFTTQVGTTGANINTYSDSGLTPQTTYYYQVNAVNSFGSSANTPTASATTFAPFTQPGLVAYWNFDEGTGETANDVTGNGHTGTLNGEVGWIPGLIGPAALNFHGTGNAVSNVVAPAAASLEFSATQSFTLSAWVDPGALRSTDAGVICASRDQGAYYGIWINSSNQWVFRGGVVGGTQTDVVGPAATENWTHVAVVQDGTAGTRTLYINGAAVATGAAQAANGGGNFWIGQANSVEQPFAGSIDEVRLYNVALAATQVQALMGPPGPPINLTWAGATSTAWNVSTDWPWVLSTANWLNGSTATGYFDSDNLTFPDGATTSTVVIASAVNPGSITFTNATSTYAISGAAISGTANLVKNGAGTVTLSSANAYTGGSTLNAGIASLNGTASTTAFTTALGAGTITLNGGELLLDPTGTQTQFKSASNFIENVVLNGGILYGNDGQEHLTGTISVTAATTLLRQWDNHSSDQTKAVLLDGVLSGSAPLNLYGTTGAANEGARIWIDNAANTYSGTVTVYASAALSGFTAPAGGNALGIGSNNALQHATVNLQGTRTAGSTDASDLYGVQFGDGVTAPVLGALAGNGNINLETFDSGTPAANLTAGGDNATTTFSGILSGIGGLTKAGSGTMTLSSGANTYTGATTVTGGILIITGNLTSSSSVSIASGATLNLSSGNFTTSGTITNNGTLVLGSGVTLSSTGAFTNNGTLNLINDPNYTLPVNFVNNGTVLTVPPADTPTTPPWALIFTAGLLLLIAGRYLLRRPAR